MLSICNIALSILALSSANFAYALSARVTTNHGSFEIKLFTETAKNEVAQFVSLAKRGYYTNNKIHKIAPSYSLSFGLNAKRADGTSGYYLKEPQKRQHQHDRQGIVSFVRRYRGTASSEIIVTLQRAPIFDNRYLVFGEVIKGIEVVRSLAAKPAKSGVPLTDLQIIKITIVGSTTKIAAPELIKVPDNEQIQKLSSDTANRLSRQIAKTQSYGPIESIEFMESVSRGLALQAFFQINFTDKTKSQLEILGSLDNEDGEFELKQFQFRR